MLYTQHPHPKSPTISVTFTHQLWPPKPEWRSNLWWLLGRMLAQWEWDSLEKIFTPLVCLLPSFFSFSLFLAALQGVQDLSSPDQRGNMYPLPWECRVLTTGMLGKFLHHFLKTLTSGKPGLNTQGLLEKWGWFYKPCVVLGTHTHTCRWTIQSQQPVFNTPKGGSAYALLRRWERAPQQFQLRPWENQSWNQYQPWGRNSQCSFTDTQEPWNWR